MPYYVFAIGGTGARCLESLLYLCAMGLGPQKLHPILVDPDNGNGNLNRTKELIIRYREIRKQINNPEPQSLFYTDVIFNEDETRPDVNVQIPNSFDPNSGLNAGMNTLGNFIEYQTTLDKGNGKYLADLLFSGDELEMDMARGYRGVPSIGSILMTNIENSPFWDVLTGSLAADPHSRVFVFASVFGGTGASGYPVISRLIKNKAPLAKVGGALLLPYFKLPDPKNLMQYKKEKVLPDSNSFMINAKAACEFYQNRFSGNDSNYILGDDMENCKEYENYQIGSKEQKNDAHMIELFAAYAALDFWKREDKTFKNFYRIHVENPSEKGHGGNSVSAGDLPDQLKALPLERFALLYLYVSDFYALVEGDKTSQLNKVAWLRKANLKAADVMAHRDELKVINDFCTAYKDWIKQNHSNSAPLKVLNEDLYLDTLVLGDPKRYEGYPINRLETELYKTAARHNNLTETLIVAASNAKIANMGGK